MVKKQLACALFFSTAALLSAQAIADNTSDPALLSFSVGAYDVVDFDQGGAADFRIEYRAADTIAWKLKPWVGLEATSDGSVWGGAGVLVDYMLTDNVYFTPNFGAGLYSRGSSNEDLGHAIEFRTQLELGYKFENAGRAGVAISHISNAGIGEKNPGTEIVSFYYHLPISSWF